MHVVLVVLVHHMNIPVSQYHRSFGIRTRRLLLLLLLIVGGGKWEGCVLHLDPATRKMARSIRKG
jgi:hypothetical protein